MSASLESVAEELRLLEESISKGEVVLTPEIQEKRNRLIKTLNARNNALNEGAQVLKG